MADPAAFRNALLAWYDAMHRDLPWRKSNDFYRVWISEIMLQQTRVEAVIPYYEEFLNRFPTVGALAQAAEPDVLAAWSGLGYYSRARNIHAAARRISEGGVPRTYEEVLALPGIGPYTAAAIASIALGLPWAAMDGNVIRVVSRLTDDPSEVSGSEVRKRFLEVAQHLLAPRRPGDFNQAMMELGATVCVPGKPKCEACPVALHCKARAAGTERELPVKLRKKQARDVELDLLLFETEGRIFLVQRASGERRMAAFWELPERKLFPRLRARLHFEITHQIVNDRFRIRIWHARTPKTLPPGHWCHRDELRSIPLTTVSRKAIERKLYH